MSGGRASLAADGGAGDAILSRLGRGIDNSRAARALGAGSYAYDPKNPTPTVGGSIVSSVYPPGSVDVSAVQQRADVLTYTTEALDGDLDVVVPLA